MKKSSKKRNRNKVRIHPVYKEKDGTYKVVMNLHLDVDDSPVSFCQPGKVRRKRVWLHLDGKLKLKTILWLRTMKGVVQEYITESSMKDDGKVVHMRDAFQAVDDDGSLTEFGGLIVHNYAYHWQREIRLYNLERCWAELKGIFAEILEDEEMASVHGVSDYEFDDRLPRPRGELLRFRPRK